MSKPEPVTFACDDFEVTAGGQSYHPHEGETVTLWPDQSVGEIMSTQALMRYGVDLEAAKGDPDEARRVAALTDDRFNALCERLADRLVAWTWTNNRGAPLPQPDGTTGPLSHLSAHELRYLLALQESERESLPNDDGASKRSLTTSSATAPRRSQM